MPPPSPRRSGGPQAFPAELSLQPTLKNCLVNLPAPLVQVLVNNDIPAQNAVIEITYRPTPAPAPSPGRGGGTSNAQKSVFVGWTGYPSKKKAAGVTGRDAVGTRGREQEMSLVELDATFAKLLGLQDGQRVSILLHIDPPQAHTVNIEPLTPADWEIIELHANFLEINLLSQIRALPNPSHVSASHPLTLHLSPTSTANIKITSLSPTPPTTSAFAKIASDAEVIVAPKVRQKTSDKAAKEQSGGQSVGGRSAGSTAKTRTRDGQSKKVMFLRGVDRRQVSHSFEDEDDGDKNEGLKAWADPLTLNSRVLKGATSVLVSISRPSGLQAPIDPESSPQPGGSDGQDAARPALRIVAQLLPWEDAPDTRHVALSSALCSSLDCADMVGETVRLEPAPAQIAKAVVKTMRVYPYSASSEGKKEGFSFGGKSQADRDEAARKIQTIYGKARGGTRLLEGPLTDGMQLPMLSDVDPDLSWHGGLIKFDPVPGPPIDPAKTTRGWLLGSERRFTIQVMPEIPRPPSPAQNWAIGEPLPSFRPSLVAVDDLYQQVETQLRNGSSILLTGGLGSGKTSFAQSLAIKLQQACLFHAVYFPCRTLVTDEARISQTKETLNRLFALAAWRARLGGYSLVILDDLDKLCPVETELQVGNDNSRSRHVSELVISIVRQYCSRDSRVILLATAQNRDSLNNVVVGGHVVRDVIHLYAPDKDGRRKILQSRVLQDKSTKKRKPAQEVGSDADSHMNGVSSSEDSVSGSDTEQLVRSLRRLSTQPKKADGLVVDPNIDYLDIAGQTDGYMPGDLVLLVSRARSEALIRSIAESGEGGKVELAAVDFTAALKGFTPSSLRNVTLQHSTTTFSSIGGLKETRQMLLETLQYPTLYAPIFAKCPLRLRSGLLLYGFPGCGKTLLASAVAGECGLNFISVKGPEILNKYIGASEKSVRDLFERAQAARPCVLFFDEFDSIAPKRGHDSTGVTDRVVNQLLTQMDGAEGLTGVYVLAATSRPDLIDPALLRPGRLDKSLLCDMPSHEDRVDILSALGSKLRLSPSITARDEKASQGEKRNLFEVARRTEGYSGADLQAVIYNAHLEAIHDKLNERPSSSQTSSKPKRYASNASKTGASVRTPDFTYFRVGESEAEIDVPMSAAHRATERAALAAQLAAHRQSVQKARAERHRSSSSSSHYAAEESVLKEKERESSEPMIEWVHIERSLAQTRPSISKDERRRLAGIYNEFVVGRNGEMPSGQGSTEIGGRSSMW